MRNYAEKVKGYSDVEIEEALHSIDKNRFPDRYALLLKENHARLQMRTKTEGAIVQEEQTKLTTPNKIGWTVGIVTFIFILIGLIVVWEIIPESYPGGGSLLGKVLGVPAFFYFFCDGIYQL